MTKVVAILEKMGASAMLRHSENGELQAAVELASLEPQAKAAILANDRSTLEAIIGCRTIAHIVITPGKDDEDEKEKEKDDAPKREDEDEEIRSLQADRIVLA